MSDAAAPRPSAAPPHTRRPRRRRSVATVASCAPTRLAVALLALLALAAPHAGLPIRSDAAAPRHWADLLAADRYTLQRLPARTLYAGEHGTDEDDTDEIFGSGMMNTTVHTERDADESLTSTTRNSYSGRGRTCEIRAVVENAPKALDVKQAVAEMIAVVGSVWRSQVPVNVRIAFEDIGEPTILAKGGGTYFVRMNDQFNTLLPVAAAEAYRKRDLNGNQQGLGKYDALIVINSKTNWYVGDVGGIGENQYDLVTVLLHECYHNFLFAGSISATIKALPNGGYEQSAVLFKDYRTRFDSFLATESGCGVLGYLSDSVNQLSTEVRLTKNQMLAEAVCNDKLYWYANGQRVAKLHAPRIFSRWSSVYHLDPNDPAMAGNEVMFPTIKRNSHARKIGPVLIRMQEYSLDPKFNGALAGCALANPVIVPVGPTDKPTQPTDVDGGAIGAVLPRGTFDEPGVGGLPIWALVLIILFAILLLLLLLALCLLLLKKKKKTIFSSSRHYTSYDRSSVSASRTKTGSGGASGYRPGWGNSNAFWSKKSSSDRKTSVANTTSQHSKHKTETELEPDVSTMGDTCPSSGKRRHDCCCKCCKPKSVTRPPPIASVHTFDPDCVPSPKSQHHHHHHHHHHHKKCKKGTTTTVGGASSSNKTKCKRKSSKHCEQVCCRSSVDITTSGEITCAPSSSTKCAPASTKCSPSSSRRCSSGSASRPTPPSTKPPSSSKVCGQSTKASCKTKPPSTKPPACRSCKSTKHCKCQNIVEIEINQTC